MKISKENKNEITTFILEGRLDSSSANEAEKNFLSSIEGVKNLILDCKALDYISSAGLRVVLKLKKLINNFKIINANLDVYDVFEMTGFTEMMDISKSLREIDVTGCPIIGKGYYGTVYRLSKEVIVKVYREDVSLESINRERALARRAFVLGIPTAISYDLVKVENCYGSVFELLDAKTLATLIIENPDKLDSYIDQYANVMNIIHHSEVKPDELKSKREEVLGWVKEIENLLDKESYTKLYKLVEDIPESNNIVHGDYHVKNLMAQGNEMFIIDMDTLSRGNCIFEYAFMYSSYISYQAVEKDNCVKFFGIEQPILNKVFRRTLEKKYQLYSKEEIDLLIIKSQIISYVQLIPRFAEDQCRPDEKELFLKTLPELLKKVDTLLP